MENKDVFDLTTRVENKPHDCGKRISYNEIRFGNQYYMLYNQQLHRVIIERLFDINGSTQIEISYCEEYELYLGKEIEDGKYVFDINEYMPKFYETLFV